MVKHSHRHNVRKSPGAVSTAAPSGSAAPSDLHGPRTHRSPALDTAGPCRLFAGSWSSGSGASTFFSAASSSMRSISLSENPVNSMSSN